jgi:hypothetical protein
MRVNEIKSKLDLVQYVKEQINIEISNDNGTFNNKKGILYTKIPDKKERLVLSLLCSHNFRVEEHHNNCYWIYIKRRVA